ELTISGRKGQKITLRPGELTDANGHVNQDASGKPFYYTYILNGDSTETWRPQFTYYGFRYLEIETDSTDSREPEIIAVSALHTSSENAVTGHFHCSNELFNRIYRLIDKAMSSNSASVLTDCPHREKLGWIEQAHLMQNSLSYRRDMSRLYEKAMADMAASQRSDGAIPTIAPEYVRFEGGFEDSPEWGAAFILCPYQAWLTYGNSDILHRYYPAMKKYMDYLATRADSNIIAYGLGDWYDIGPKEPGYSQLTSNGVTATAIYFQNASTMARIAEITGHDDDAAAFRNLAGDIRQAFNCRFLNSEEGYYDRNSQTANSMALVLGFPDKEIREKVARNLADDIISRGYSLTAGDIGYRYLLKALEDNGMSDIIYVMNTGFDHPGYGWQLAHGATALTESWQAYGFVSNNHMMLG
ncbi:MAG: family 78 glycoside hydrolase catalytic domain, partial [Muribaculaceae bacterium]|nr:family 78 glycoside hydrolase catalytic domain [Muribaculaceae bacterium]